ncbi:hypothetical protein ACTXM3_00730 [Glutamicibacter arilaitensis]|uniref:Phospholipase A2 domain-containing protein n=1 Tax=Glutamicibacter arilaitensis TaxID=256701 RepID=A0A2N7S247_9MICC|nr:hypothetical protein [Glutamicibacter arilaitensis]PMQ20204.1 hypothetical protein CIK84_00845 [Glutamicibacter arilaitensis]
MKVKICKSGITLLTSLALVISSLSVFAAPSYAAPSNSEKKAAERQITENVDSTMEFTTTRSGQVYFDIEKAKAAGADAETLEVGQLLNNYSAAQSAPAGGVTTYGMPLWGNWCGPGHGGGRAVDTLDSLCRTHDRCYGSRGYFACSCDRNLVSGIKRNAYKMGGKERAMASAVSVYFTYSFCNPFK